MVVFEKLEEHLDDMVELKNELRDIYVEINDDEQENRDEVFDCLKHYIKVKSKLLDLFEKDHDIDTDKDNGNDEYYEEGR